MKQTADILTVTLNPAIDRVIEVNQLIPGQHETGITTGRTPGGKGVNISRVLTQIGLTSTATGFLGEDNFSTFASLFDSRITNAFITLPGSTRENITLTDAATGLDTHICDRGLAVDGDGLNLLRKKIHKHVNRQTIVIFSGSLPPGVKIQFFTSLIDDCIATGAKVAVDTSGKALRKMAGKKLWLTKPNIKELVDFVGKPLPSRNEQLEAARQMASDVEHVLMSCGPDGVYLVTQKQTLHAHVELGQPLVNTVGCGDTLLAVFIGTLLNASPADALAKATALATASAAHQASATFDKKLARNLQKKVAVKTITRSKA